MKRDLLKSYKGIILFVLVGCFIFFNDSAAYSQIKQPDLEYRKKLVSYVDTNLKGAQKYVLRVDGKPFYMTNIQIRLDNMRYNPGWDKVNTESVIKQAASDGFNTVSIPIHWREVEPEKNKFNWTILDEYLSLVNKYNLKMELLWFGANSGGITQRLGSSNHLRTPDYVLYSPNVSKLGSYDSYSPEGGRTPTTSEYTVRREAGDYSLDLNDEDLRERETFVLDKVMAHIASWDTENGSKHPIIGVQIGNEVIGYNNPFPNSLVISYLSDVASAVKKSDYNVWTRVNSVFWNIPSRIITNETLRTTLQGTNIDFVGIDTYRHHFKTDEAFVASMRENLPYIGRNYRMIMETGAGEANAAQLRLAALSGNNAFSYYDFSRIYDINEGRITSSASHIEDIRLVNRILNSDVEDIALKAHGYGLFVHNWEGVKSSPSTSTDGIVFFPAYPTSQGISIIRSNTEIVLMSTKGGRFALPDSLEILSASKGYFDRNNEWIKQGEISLGNRFRGTTIFVEPGATIRLIRPDSGETSPVIYQAEFAQLGGGAEISTEIGGIGFAGNGYVKLPSTGGATIEWEKIDGGSGGDKNIRIRYSLGTTNSTKLMLEINGKVQFIQMQPTNSWKTYKYLTINVPLNSGINNSIRLETTNNTLRIDRVVYYEFGGNIDELQVL